MSGNCESCGKKLDPSLTVDAGVLRKNASNDWEILLIQRGRDPFEVF
jgi:hypothetical protein